ncbi:S1/P1 nuclease [Pseudoxanthomonas sp. SGT-18]|uniref:S1/P1 nuclease n=1 Tax=Pseudoxanthomonas sp. SGT-18 TaxID=2493087 RepID=UPI000F628D31|nr:S1/P1 nuclease [Pseudoxanthomonas sp. SGT-18]
MMSRTASTRPIRARRHSAWLPGFLLLLSVALPAQAWGPLGHRLVARLAEEQLSPAARAEAQRLLRGEPEPGLAGIANWADNLRGSDPVLGRRTAAWHYVNIGEADCHYERQAHCPDGNCVNEALEAQARILADRSRSDAERLQALKFVVHLAGDAHQPLHAGYRHDRGGNNYQVNYRGKGSNLHSLWDSGLLATRRLDEEAWLQRLRTLPAPAVEPVGRPPRPGFPLPWVEQSCRTGLAPGVYPQGHVVDDAYVDAHLPTQEAQLRLGAARLAEVLEATLGDPG